MKSLRAAPKLMSNLRYLALLLPVYAIFSSMQVGCGMASTDATSTAVTGGKNRCCDGSYGGYGCPQGYGYDDPGYGYDEPGYGYGYGPNCD